MNPFEQALAESQKLRAEIDAKPDYRKPLVQDYKERGHHRLICPEALELLTMCRGNVSEAARFAGVTKAGVQGWLRGSYPKPETLEQIEEAIKKLKNLKRYQQAVKTRLGNRDKRH